MKKTVELFTCEHCGAKFENDEKAYEKHVLAHDIVYVGLERGLWRELQRALYEAHWSGIQVPGKVVEKLNSLKLGVKL